MAKPPTSKAIEALISQALAVEAESTQEAGALGFMARAMALATLPHRKVEGSHFQRVNGNYTLTLLAPPEPGLPYGSIPRLLIAWLSTEAIKTQSRELELGDSMSGFMRELGLVPTGGRWGSITRLKDQTNRLFCSAISAYYNDKQKRAEMGYRVADSSILWWDPKQPDQKTLWKSSVTISEPFYREIVNYPIPVDLRVLKALKQSPLALDIYVWLTYRMSYLSKPTTIPWEVLSMQFGSNYAAIRDFRAHFNKELKRVVTLYPEADAMPTDHGLALKPSLPHVRKR
jgi:Plasmid encoded RepA protein